MTSNQEVPWARILAEGTAIVASILLAFAIDAWWEERREREREVELLLALKDDMASSKEQVQRFIQFHEEVQAATLKLLQASRASATDLSVDEIDRLLLDMSWWDAAPRFTTGTLNSLIASGELSLITNDELRNLIADWPDWIQRVISTQQQEYDFFQTVWTPFLRDNQYFLPIGMIDATMPANPEVRTIVPDLEFERTVSPYRLIELDEFPQILMQRFWIQSDMKVWYGDSMNLLNRTIDLIESSLASKKEAQ